MTRKIKKINWLGPMPKCDFCSMQGARPLRDGVYDTPTTQGPWANACHTHMLQYSPKHTSLICKRVRLPEQPLPAPSPRPLPPGEKLL